MMKYALHEISGLRKHRAVDHSKLDYRDNVRKMDDDARFAFGAEGKEIGQFL